MLSLNNRQKELVLRLQLRSALPILVNTPAIGGLLSFISKAGLPAQRNLGRVLKSGR